jgi:hypothetical protein
MTTETQVSVSAFEKSEPSYARRNRFVVDHNPCPKFRVIVLLGEPWKAADFKTQGEANAAWREFVVALASTLGLQADQSCSDTSRLFYFPRTRPNGPKFQFAHIHGEPCDIHVTVAAAQGEGLFNPGSARAR